MWPGMPMLDYRRPAGHTADSTNASVDASLRQFLLDEDGSFGRR
jgi:hypothetical protein